jgi:hypothetical protein
VNIAFQALLLILFYLPGALFIGALFGKLSKDQELPVIAPSITGRAAVALLFAGAFHAVWLAAIVGLGRLGVPIASTADKFFLLLSSDQQSRIYLNTDAWESTHLDWLFWYFATICIGATGAGALLHKAIAYYQLDYKVAWLRFKPEWHYFLSGQYAEEPQSVVWVDALTEIGDSTVVYSGLVKEYWFDDKTGALDTLWLDAAERVCVHLCPDGPAAEPSAHLAKPGVAARVVQIPGARFALKMSHVRNVNIIYISLAAKRAAGQVRLNSSIAPGASPRKI